MTIRSEIESLVALAGDDALTAQVVVDASRDEPATYPQLHAHLWQTPEKELAAEARLSRAHRLLIRIQITSTEGITTRLLVHTRDVPGYQTVDVVASMPDLRAAKLSMLRADIVRARDRLRAYSAILAPDLVIEVDEALQQVQKKLEPPGEQAVA